MGRQRRKNKRGLNRLACTTAARGEPRAPSRKHGAPGHRNTVRGKEFDNLAGPANRSMVQNSTTDMTRGAQMVSRTPGKSEKSDCHCFALNYVLSSCSGWMLGAKVLLQLNARTTGMSYERGMNLRKGVSRQFGARAISRSSRNRFLRSKNRSKNRSLRSRDRSMRPCATQARDFPATPRLTPSPFSTSRRAEECPVCTPRHTYMPT